MVCAACSGIHQCKLTDQVSALQFILDQLLAAVENDWKGEPLNWESYWYRRSNEILGRAGVQ